jgi:hypothetical protein
MPPVFIWVLTFGGAIVTLRARLQLAFGAFLAAIFLVPAGTLVPGIQSSFFGVHRLLLITLSANLIMRLRRREISLEVLRPSRIHAALAAWLVASFVLGVVLADPLLPISQPTFLWLPIVDQTVMFLVALAVIRSADDPFEVARMVVAVFGVTAAIAVWEHFSRVSYGEWFFRRTPYNTGASGVLPLATRGGEIRVRSSVQFALAYAWVATLLLPLVIVVASRARRMLTRFAPALVVASIVFTLTRSAYVGAAVSALALVLTSRADRRITWLVAFGAILTGLILSGSGIVERTFVAQGAGSVEVRTLRTPLVLELTSTQPITGGGFAGLALIGIKTTDASFLLTYADLGVIGVVFLALLLASVLACAWPALRAPPGRDRALGAAVFVGLLAAFPAAASFDEFQILPAATSFWLLAAFGVTLSERVLTSSTEVVRAPTPLLRSAALGVAGVALGVAVMAVTPRAEAMTLQFTTVSPGAEATATGTTEFIARTLVNSACQVMTVMVRRLPDTEVSCLDPITGTGLGHVRLEMKRGGPLEGRARFLVAYARRAVPDLRAFVVETRVSATPTWARTAPVWGGLGAFGFSLGSGSVRGWRRRWGRGSRAPRSESFVPRTAGSSP